MAKLLPLWKGQRMIKILTIGVLLYLFYRLIDSPGRLKHGNSPDELDSNEDEFIDYEEVE